MFTVILTEPADSDVDGILQWLEERSRRGAKNWLNSYRRAIAATRKSADSFGLAPESADHPDDIREFTFSTRHGNTYPPRVYPSRRHRLCLASSGHWPIASLSR